MKYYLDTEFNGYRGDLISLALSGADGRELYLVSHRPHDLTPWVRDNVAPVLFAWGTDPTLWDPKLFGVAIAEFLQPDKQPCIVADWPDDIRYFCECLLVGPGQMVNINRMRFDLVRVDAYPTELAAAVQHNALWDARALKVKIQQG